MNDCTFPTTVIPDPFNPGTYIPCCVDPRPFPQPFNSPSLLNWIEVIIIKELCGPRNHFETLNPNELTLQQISARFNLHNYDLYCYGNKIKKIHKTDPVINQTKYVFINQNIKCKFDKEFIKRIDCIYRTRYGLVKYPIVMPSRGMIFR